jgi:ketosteroid isomerase-like protein
VAGALRGYRAVSEADVRAVFLEHDRCWNALDIERLAALWDPDDPRASYLGDEYHSPVVGADALRQHWGRTGTRLRGAHVASEPELIDLLADDLALAIVNLRWSFAGVEGGPWRTGRSWVSAVLRRTDAGWRFVSYMERLSEFSDVDR